MPDDPSLCWICRMCAGKWPGGLTHEEAALLYGFVMGARAALSRETEITCSKHMKLLLVGMHDAGIKMAVGKVAAKAKA